MEPLSQLFLDAGTLMLSGMVFVFIFLGLLVIFINTILAPLAKKYPDIVAETKVRRANNRVNNKLNDGLSPSIVAAITSAVISYRKKHELKK